MWLIVDGMMQYERLVIMIEVQLNDVESYSLPVRTLFDSNACVECVCSCIQDISCENDCEVDSDTCSF